MKPELTIIGLGPGALSYLTMEAYEAVTTAPEVLVRTLKHPVIDELIARGAKFSSFDHMYEQAESFDEVYESIADAVFALAQTKPVMYAVPGNPFVAERSVELLMAKAEAAGIPVRVIHGTSFIDAMITTLHKDPVKGLHIVDALNIEQTELTNLVDQVIIQIYDPMVGSNVKLALMAHFPDDHEVVVVRGAGIPGEEQILHVPLYDLDRCEALDHLASVYVPCMDKDKPHVYAFSELMDIMTRLRDVDGCPWDQEQTHDSLKSSLLEEAYEVIDAIEENDLYALEEELGDVLLQVAFHSAIASENGYFSSRDVITGICNKLINRHPHVFGDVDVADSDEVLVNWEQIKREEKSHESITEAMKALPKAMPATLRAYKVQKKAAQVGFDWDHIDDAIAKIKEELDEFLEALHANQLEEIESEMGDLIFAIVNVCRFAKLDPELCLGKTITKFIQRFEFIETSEVSKKEGISNLSLEVMDELWNIAKNQRFEQKN